MNLQPGQTLGRYQILGPLGTGGMATVYRAYQPALERVVALKLLRAQIGEDPGFRGRFTREARAVARLRHPNIVQVFDFDEIEGQAFMAMEFIEGGTLKQHVATLAGDGQRLPAREIGRIVSEVADALDHAHAQGVIHRDIKPSNVLLTRDGKAVVCDFGIARILAAVQHTQTGVGIGTPEYMSPEQGQGLAVDARTDIYSLGILAYELIVGRVPFSADTPLATVLAHIRDPLPLPSQLNPLVGATTERVLLKALAKDPAQRFERASLFAAALARTLMQDQRSTAPTVLPGAVIAARSPLSRRVVLALGGLAALALIGGAAMIAGTVRVGPTIAPMASQEPSIALHLLRSDTPEGMNGPTVYIFRVDGIELKGKGAQVTVTPRGTGVVNEVENVVLAFVQSDWPSGTYRVALRVEGQQAETTIAYTWREQPTPAPAPTRAIAPTASQEPGIALHLLRSETPEGMNGPTRYMFRVDGIELKGKGAQVTVTPRGQGAVNEGDNVVLAYVPSDAPSGTYRVALRVEGQQVEATIAYTWREQPTPAPAPAPTPPVAPSSVTPAPSSSGPYQISGRVADAATGLPIGGMPVQATSVRGSCCGNGHAWTDGSGNYAMGVPSEAYWVYVGPEGTPYGHGFWRDGLSLERATQVVARTADVSGIDFALTPGFSISGRIAQSGTGLGLAGAKACAVEVGASCLYMPLGFADESGRYTIKNLSAGTYSVCFGLGADCNRWWRGAAGAPAARAPAASPIRLDASVTGIDATLPVYAIRGRIVDEVTGNPIKGAVMAAYAAAPGCGNEACNPISYASFDESGRYTAYAPAGTYRLELSAYDARRGVRLEKWWRDASSFADATPFVLSSNVEGVDLTLSGSDTPKPPKPTPDPCTVAPLDPDATGVDGYVLWGTAPLGGVRVELRAYAAGGGGGTLYGSTTTDADGYYRIAGAQTTRVELWIPRIAGYNMPNGAFNFGPCGPDRLLRPNQVQRLSEIELQRPISGISVASGSSVPALPLTVTWNAEQQVTAYCADLLDTTTQAALGNSTCPRFQGATLLRGPSYTTPPLVAGHQYVLLIRGLLGQTPIYFVSTTFTAR